MDVESYIHIFDFDNNLKDCAAFHEKRICPHPKKSIAVATMAVNDNVVTP